jgi:glycosyltransferase involved in cell wall biosynthesis
MPAHATKKVTIVIPVYNGESTIHDTLVSVEAQTYPSYQAIICNNGSTDGTVHVAENFLRNKNLPIKLLNYPSPSGMILDWNRALNVALSFNAEFIKLLPADDIISPDCVSKQVECLEQESLLGAAFCPKGLLVDNKKTRYPWQYPSRRLTSKDQRELLFSPANWLGEPGSALIRTTVVRHIGRFDERYPYYGDLHYWLRILSHYPVKIIDANTYWFRIHPLSLTRSQNKQAAQEFIALARDIGLNSGSLKPTDIPIIAAKAHATSLLRSIYQSVCRARFRKIATIPTTAKSDV